MSDAPSRFLFATWDAGGGLHPLLALARGLQNRGHEVLVLGDPASREEVLGSELVFEPWKEAPAAVSRQPDGVLVRDWEAKGLGGFRKLVENLAYGPSALHARDVMEVCRRASVDAVVAEQFLPGAIVAAEHLGLPRCVVMPNLDTRLLAGRPPFGPGFRPLRGPFGWLRDSLVTRIGDGVIQSGLGALNNTRHGLGLDPVDDVHQVSRRADQVLVLTAPSFEWEGAEVPANTHYVGPVLDDPVWNDRSWTPPWPPELDGPVILVSFGTSYQGQEELYSRAIDALALVNCRGIVTLGGMFDVEAFEAPQHVVVVDAAPHPPILEQAAAAVIHCGHSSTMRALSVGVPIVGIPMGRDQNDNAIRLVARDAGVRISRRASALRLRRAIERVANDPTYRRGAEQLGERIRAETSVHSALDLLERLPAQRSPVVEADPRGG